MSYYVRTRRREAVGIEAPRRKPDESAEGFVASFGVIPGLNTSSFTAGQALWLSSTAGQLTNVKPTQPAHSVFIGYCLSVNSSSGRIFVNPQNGYELDELHNVLISSPSNGQALTYESSTGLWKNTSVDSLPDQTSNNGKYLTTNGSVASWSDISGAVYSEDAPASPTVGQLWIESDVDINAYSMYQRWSRTLTGSETVFTGLEGTQTLSYPAGLEQVYLNGVLLVRGTDYTATNGSTVTLTSAGQSGDVIEILSPNTFSVADTYTQSQVDTALSLKANLSGPTFTGTVVLPSTTSIGSVSSTEIGYIDGVTSSIQTQLDTKASTGKAIAMAMVFGG